MKRIIQATIGFVIGLALLWFLFRGTSWANFFESLRRVQLVWFVAALIPLVVSFFARVQRWTYIVRAVHPAATFRAMFSATQIGFLGNFVLPARLGELMRAVVLARLAKMPVTQAFAMVTLDRVTDLIGLLATMGVALLAFKPTQVIIPAKLFGLRQDTIIPAGLLEWSEWSAVALLVGIIVMLVLLYVRQALALRISDFCLGLVSKRLAALANRLLQQFAEGLHVFRSASDMTKSTVFSLLTWACFLISCAAFCAAFRLNWPWYTPFVLQAALAVSISVPGTPGFIGQFQLPIVAGLIMVIPDVHFADALAMAIVMHLVNFLLVVAIGLFCLYWEGLSLLELSKESAHSKDDAHTKE